MNQCDGCRRGLPKLERKHRDFGTTYYHILEGVGSYPGEQMGCTADLYTENVDTKEKQ